MLIFRKLRKNLIENKKLKRYFIYAIGEILLVMIGILLAFQVNRWNDKRLNRNAELTYYKNIKNQIIEDRALISGEIDYNNWHKIQFEYASDLIGKDDKTKLDSLGKIINRLLQYSDFDKEGNIYSTLVNSGEIKLLKNQDIVNRIRALEEKYNYINRMENIHYDVVASFVIPSTNDIVNFYTNEIENSDPIFTFQFRNLIGKLLMIMTEKDQTYNSAISEIDAILLSIEEELE